MDDETFGLLIDSLRRYVRDVLVPAEDEVESTDEIPPALVTGMRALGLFGLTIPEAYGGLGLSLSQEVVAVRELTWASVAFRSLVGTNLGIGSQGVLIDGTEAQRAAWLPRLASGEVLASFCLTEPDAGSDAKSLRLRAERRGEHWVLDGTKRYITNALRAGLFTVMARTDPDLPGADGISAFLVPADTAGITVMPADKKMGQRGTKTSDIHFDEVEVGADALLGGVEGKGFRTAMKVLNRGRIHIAAVSCGMAERMLHESVEWAKTRRQFGRSIGEFQLVQAMLADSRTESLAAWALVREAAAAFDAHGPAAPAVRELAAAAKLFASEMAGRVADRAVQVHGGAGYMNACVVERFYRDARLLRIYEGTTQIQQLVIARALLRE